VDWMDYFAKFVGPGLETGVFQIIVVFAFCCLIGAVLKLAAIRIDRRRALTHWRPSYVAPRRKAS
jgi:hypothetical protein